MTEWYKISENKPLVGERVLIVVPGSSILHGTEMNPEEVFIGELAEGHEDFFYTDDNSVENVEYWMPLPQLPKKQ